MATRTSKLMERYAEDDRLATLLPTGAEATDEILGATFRLGRRNGRIDDKVDGYDVYDATQRVNHLWSSSVVVAFFRGKYAL